MGGCVGEMWALKAYKFFHDSAASEVAEGASCCAPGAHPEGA